MYMGLISAVSGTRNMKSQLRTADRYATLLEVNRAAVHECGVNEIFGGMCSAVRKVIPYDRVGLSLYAPETRALKLAATQGCGPESFYRIGLTLDCAETHHGWVFQHRKPLLRRDLNREVQFKVEEYNVQEGIRSYCAVPLVVRGESLGVMIVLSSRANQYSEGHAEFLQEISNQLVLALKSLMPSCPKHLHSKLLCPRCIASGGGKKTASIHGSQLSEWGKQGGRGRKKAAGGFTGEVLS